MGGMAEVLIMSGEVSYTKARKELAKNQWKTAGMKFMKGMKIAKQELAMTARKSDGPAKSDKSDAPEEGGDGGEAGGGVVADHQEKDVDSASDASSVDHQAALEQA